MVLSRRRPRTVLGCLVACRGPVRPSGLSAGWLPGAWWVAGFPWCGLRLRGGPGPRLGWPCRLLRGGAGPCRVAPGPVPEPASPDHQRCRVVTGRLGVVFPQGPQPVLGGPAGSVCGVDDDDGQPGVGGHLDQTVAELSGGDAGDGAPEVPAAAAAGGPAAGAFASFGAGFGEVEVLDGDGAGAAGLGGSDQGADGGAQVSVAGGGRQPGQGKGDGGRDAQDIAVRRDNGHSQVTVVDVDRYYRVCLQLSQGRRGGRGGLPRGVEVPAAAGRVMADVVADRAAGGLGGDLVAAVGEPDWSRQPVAAMRPVRQMGQRGGQFDLQPTLVGVPADRLIPPCLRGLAVGGQEQPGRIPLLSPLGLGQACGSQVVPHAQQRLPAPDHRHGPGLQLLLYPGQPGLQRPQADRLGVPFRSGGIPARPPGRGARRNSQPGLDPDDAGQQACPVGAQVLPGQPDLVVAGPGDRPGPPRRRGRSHRPLPRRAGPRPAPRVQPPLSTPGAQVLPGQRSQVPAHRPQHRLIARRRAQSGPDPRACWRRRHERRGNRAQRSSHQRAAVLPGPGWQMCICSEGDTYSGYC